MDETENTLLVYSPPIGKSDHVLLEFNFTTAYDIISNKGKKKLVKIQKRKLCIIKEIFK